MYKFGENVSNTLQDTVLTMFRDAHTYARTDARTHARTNSSKPLCLQPHYTEQRHKNTCQDHKLLFRPPYIMCEHRRICYMTCLLNIKYMLSVNENETEQKKFCTAC